MGLAIHGKGKQITDKKTQQLNDMGKGGI